MEETTLAKVKGLQQEVRTALRQRDEAQEQIECLARGTNANIDNLVVRLLAEGTVSVRLLPGDMEFVLSERQFRGLMGWGRKHIGEGPNGPA